MSAVRRVAICRSETTEAMLASAIELAGGLDINPGSTVLIKPNENSDDPFPATSDPETVAALVRYVRRFRPARLVVADASFVAYLPTIKTMQKTGVYQAATGAGAEVAAFEEGDFVSVLPDKAANWRWSFRMARLYLEADYVISQPVIKTHKYAVFSMALKNTIGAVLNADRPLMHSLPTDRFRRMTAELNLARPADFVVLDGRQAMVTGGPFSGRTQRADLIVATTDLVAADAVGLAVLKHLGTVPRIQDKPVWEQTVLEHAVELGLGVNGPDEIELVADGVPELESIRGFLKERKS